MKLLWLFMVCFVHSPAVAFKTDEEKCLDIPEVNPKKYFHLNSKSLPIILETSGRITHQLSTHVFYIFIKEVLGYSRIEISMHEDDFQIESVIERLSEYTSANVTEPPATINLEVWVRPDYDTYATDLVKDCGILAPPGRFGWFIPINVSRPIKEYYQKYAWTEDIREIHWSYFINRDLVKRFDINDEIWSQFIEGNHYNRVDGSDSEYVCNNASICSKSMYTPVQCRNKPCAVLLAPNVTSVQFLIDQINESQLLVKVLWVGNKLKAVVEELTSIYQLRSIDKSLLIFSWYPSEIIIDENDFISVTFKNSELSNFTHNEKIGYKYEMHRLLKMAFSKIEKNAKPLYDGLRSFKFEKKDYTFLLTTYKDNPKMSLRSIACQWMQNNQNKWQWWKKETETVIFIGGIFPMEGSSYNGKGIMRAAAMAVSAVNKNKTVLPDYRLQLIVYDGKCKADNVMKSFIDFIVEGYYPQLVGVLGPACSETVEPLAGVSKHYHIMVISYSAEGASFSDRKKYPYFFRTIGENKHYKHVYLKLLQYFKWKRVAALTEDGQKYTEYISLMQDELEKNNINFIANKKFPRERETEAMTKYLEDLKSKRARIIIADVVDDVARTVMCEAYRLNMTAAQGYVWFLPMWLNTTWYDTDYYNRRTTERVNCTTKEMVKAITGYFGMTHAYFAPDDTIMQENITVRQWRDRYRIPAPFNSDYAGFAYDAVWTYALALDKIAKVDAEAVANLHSENTTNKLVREVEKTDFYGVSGRIKFRGGPSRFSVINIMQWYNNSMHTVGHFYPNLSDDTPDILGGDLKINDKVIRWFTPDGSTPEDGALPPEICAVEGLANAFGVECHTAIVILNIMVAGVLLTTVLIVCFYMKRKYERKVQQTKNIIKALGLPFDFNNTNLDKWELSRQSVVINRKLGEGAFGTVYGGEASLAGSGWCAVAVKTLKIGSTTEEKLDFLSEAEVMKRFDHKNIIRLLGVCTKDEPVYTIMEFMLYGDLKTYLLARRHLVNKNTDESEEVSPKRLTYMALDIASGLSYLAENKYVHRDVACRNCLVNGERRVKLGDFGMTRATFDKDYYRFIRRGMMPVRWMAPESLQMGVFTTASDMWSYGVVLFEIITLGSFPFQGKSNLQVLELVKSGHTLDVPRGAKPTLEGIMRSCWRRDSKRRPVAAELVEFLATHPRLLTPCLDAPVASAQLDDSDQLDLTLSDFRVRSPSRSPTKPTNGALSEKTPRAVPEIPRVNSEKTRTTPEIPNANPEKLRPCPEVPLSSVLVQANPGKDDQDEAETIILDATCLKEPLLGASKSTSSLLSLGRFKPLKDKDDEGDGDYMQQDRPRGQGSTPV